MYELRDAIDRLEVEYSIDEILDEIGFSQIASYVKRYSSVIDWAELIGDNDDAIKAIKGVAKYIRPKGCLTKDDIKKEISDFIDFWCV